MNTQKGATVMKKHIETVLEILAEKIEDLQDEIFMMEMEIKDLKRENTELRAAAKGKEPR